MKMEYQGWKLEVLEAETQSYYDHQITNNEVNWDIFENTYKDVVNFLAELSILIRKPFISRKFADNGDGTYSYELAYRFYGSATGGEYEIDIDMVNICIENKKDNLNNNIVELYLYNVNISM